MKSIEALRILAELSVSQWGLFTTAQAAARGVSRLTLTRLAESGQLERLTHGVYRDAGAPGDEFEGLRAAWLSLDPAHLAEERLGLGGTAVISGATAAWLHGVGDLLPEPYEFSTPRRRQTQRSEIRFKVRDLDDSKITVESGLPVTILEQTISDLVAARTDLSLVAKVVADSAAKTSLDLELLSDLLDPLAARNGITYGSGEALLEHLMRTAGIDKDSLAEHLASSSLGRLVAADYLAKFSEQIQGMLTIPDLDESIRSISASIAENEVLNTEDMILAIGVSQILREGMTEEFSHAVSTSLPEQVWSKEVLGRLARIGSMESSAHRASNEMRDEE
ncbi:type IV toxin-antitoxin system AbiEi family antitoxin domain-containing protein [Glycomyces xiaoerkulensis]|uniref:type IV toxin-antitoxin system AbiEi family antitoxin domain-containing protein n=1 Tax=Glycomyces xiaoerkulensis TaxID=2038139 RepID=UPI000C2597EC|nr:type IV toxin-antitoxin system AbiEi family antitoxin domain-containing protein [Glycomyces xiaoerkulensis]